MNLARILPKRRPRPVQDEHPAGLLAEPELRGFPYADITESQLAAYRLAAASERGKPGPRFYPAPPPATAPLPALPGNARVPAPAAVAAVVADPRLTRQVAAELQARPDAADADEKAPVYDKTAAAWRPLPAPDLAAGQRARQAVGSLVYPKWTGHATGAAYGALMHRVDVITGTSGTARGYWPLPALDPAGDR